MKTPLTAAQQEALEPIIREALAVTREHLESRRRRIEERTAIVFQPPVCRQREWPSWSIAVN